LQFIGERQLSWINEGDYSKSIREKDQFLGLLVSKLSQAGAKMALGTDTGPSMTIQGQTVIEEMLLYKTYDLDNIEILKMATINAAEVLGEDANKGMLLVGKDADLLLLRDNPATLLETLTEPVAVIQNGQWFGIPELRLLKQHGKNHYSFYHTLGLFLEHIFSK